MLIILYKWKWRQDVLMINLDDFNIILGLDFLNKVKIAQMPYLNGIVISSELVLILIPCYKVLMKNNIKDIKSLVDGENGLEWKAPTFYCSCVRIIQRCDTFKTSKTTSTKDQDWSSNQVTVNSWTTNSSFILNITQIKLAEVRK